MGIESVIVVTANAFSLEKADSYLNTKYVIEDRATIATSHLAELSPPNLKTGEMIHMCNTECGPLYGSTLSQSKP